MAKLARVQEKKQIKWAIQLFKVFILFAVKREVISPSQKHTLDKELEELAEAAMGEDEPESIATQLNNYIGMINAQMKQQIESIHYAPFPTFSIAIAENLHSAILDQIDMVERTLAEAGQGGVIDWDEESDYFVEVLQIFAQVETHKIQAQEGMAKLVNIMQKINKAIPPECALPLPNINAYK